jgi:hypothetical protein
MLDEPAIDDLLRAAIAEADTQLPRAGRGRLVIKSLSARSRRPTQ